MGLSTGHQYVKGGLGNTAKADTLSGVSENTANIYNYNKITLHLNLGSTRVPELGGNSGATTMVLTKTECSYNGQPTWGYSDGAYTINDGDEGCACCGYSHLLRYGGGKSSQGKWEVVSWNTIFAFTTANTLNFFAIQGSGSTQTGGLGPINSGDGLMNSNGGWINITGNTGANIGEGSKYSAFKSGGTQYAYGALTAVTAFGTYS
jgi:hypothetical protein